MSPELQQLLTGLGVVVIGALTALVEKIRRDLAKNTEATEGAKKAAEDSQKAAESIQQATFDRLDYDRLRRMEAAVLTLDECQPCRAKILELTDRRRVWRPATEPHENAQSPEGLR